MSKVYVGSYKLRNYPDHVSYYLADKFGRRLLDYLGEDIFMLLLDSRTLVSFHDTKLNVLSDDSYKVVNASKALEGFLEKLINGKKLRMDKGDKIGEVFGKKDSIVRAKIKDKKLIAKAKSIWDYSRNDIMHYSPNKKKSVLREYELVDDIIELVKELYSDFYGKSEPDKEIKDEIMSYPLNYSKKTKTKLSLFEKIRIFRRVVLR